MGYIKRVKLIDLRDQPMNDNTLAFEIVQVTNDVDLQIGQYLTIRKARDLCRHPDWEVTILPMK